MPPVALNPVGRPRPSNLIRRSAKLSAYLVLRCCLLLACWPDRLTGWLLPACLHPTATDHDQQPQGAERQALGPPDHHMGRHLLRHVAALAVSGVPAAGRLLSRAGSLACQGRRHGHHHLGRHLPPSSCACYGGELRRCIICTDCLLRRHGRGTGAAWVRHRPLRHRCAYTACTLPGELGMLGRPAPAWLVAT